MLISKLNEFLPIFFGKITSNASLVISECEHVNYLLGFPFLALGQLTITHFNYLIKNFLTLHFATS